MFPKIGGKPHNGWFIIMENPIKIDDLGVPLFLETAIFSPIAISLGSYMDKAAGRSPCTGKIFTQDVSVLSRSCLGHVSVLSR